MSDSAQVTVDVDDRGVATLTLASPGTFNAMSAAWGVAFRAAVDELTGRPGVRVIVLRAEGRAFCVGGDISGFAGTDDPKSLLLGLAGDLHAGMVELQRLDAPLVAAVQGVAAGAGLSLVCAADIAIAGRSAFFSCAYTAAGLSPDGGMTWTLPRLVGPRRATEMLLTNRRVGAEEAAEIGLVTETVDDDALAARVEAIAAQLALGSPASFGATRRLLESAVTATYEDQLAAEAESIASLAAGPGGQEGISAFLEKRKPVFPA